MISHLLRAQRPEERDAPFETELAHARTGRSRVLRVELASGHVEPGLGHDGTNARRRRDQIDDSFERSHRRHVQDPAGLGLGADGEEEDGRSVSDVDEAPTSDVSEVLLGVRRRRDEQVGATNAIPLMATPATRIFARATTLLSWRSVSCTIPWTFTATGTPRAARARRSRTKRV